eukprot:TRINITY_DN67993_c1_g6_i1.p1 TRINITY_DN67993_c1_g6~~TRINITY_DN67993_c1_g6_i1.p1  ORF type:complete len:324 (-),score=1.07 TRINITY_DN67993_c1_g6_i1:267-1238(-)
MDVRREVWEAVKAWSLPIVCLGTAYRYMKNPVMIVKEGSVANRFWVRQAKSMFTSTNAQSKIYGFKVPVRTRTWNLIRDEMKNDLNISAIVGIHEISKSGKTYSVFHPKNSPPVHHCLLSLQVESHHTSLVGWLGAQIPYLPRSAHQCSAELVLQAMQEISSANSGEIVLLVLDSASLLRLDKHDNQEVFRWMGERMALKEFAKILVTCSDKDWFAQFIELNNRTTIRPSEHPCHSAGTKPPLSVQEATAILAENSESVGFVQFVEESASTVDMCDGDVLVKGTKGRWDTKSYKDYFKSLLHRRQIVLERNKRFWQEQGEKWG